MRHFPIRFLIKTFYLQAKGATFLPLCQKGVSGSESSHVGGIALFLTVDRAHSTFMGWPISLMERPFSRLRLPPVVAGYRCPRNGPSCRGFMTNPLIDLSFTCSPHHHTDDLVTGRVGEMLATLVKSMPRGTVVFCERKKELEKTKKEFKGV